MREDRPGAAGLHVAALTGGRDIPSARFRVRQLIEPLARQGIALEEWKARYSSYPPRPRALRPLWLAGGLMQRLPQVLRSRRCDAVLLQRELISTFFTLERLAGRPRILDVDDAIWLHRRGAFAGRLAAACDGLICGNPFLADYFSRYNPRVTVIPTAVDTDAYVPAPGTGSEAPVMGWIGTSVNFAYLYGIEGALAEVLRRVPGARLSVMADRPPAWRELPLRRVSFQPWSPGGELAMLQGLTVGLMPLDGSDWAKGKCSFKMLQYMSCGVPAVVSPVGMNEEVLARGAGALPARGQAQWVDAVAGLLRDRAAAADLGRRGRALVQAHYSLRTVAPRVARFLREVVGG